MQIIESETRRISVTKEPGTRYYLGAMQEHRQVVLRIRAGGLSFYSRQADGTAPIHRLSGRLVCSRADRKTPVVMSRSALGNHASRTATRSSLKSDGDTFLSSKK